MWPGPYPGKLNEHFSGGLRRYLCETLYIFCQFWKLVLLKILQSSLVRLPTVPALILPLSQSPTQVPLFTTPMAVRSHLFVLIPDSESWCQLHFNTIVLVTGFLSAGAHVVILAKQMCRAIYQHISEKVSLALRKRHKRKGSDDCGIVYESTQIPS